MKSITINNSEICYTLIKEERKTLSAHVYPDKNIVVKAPKIASIDEINDFIKRKYRWITKQILYFDNFCKKSVLDYTSGSEIFYLGKQYQLIVERAELQEYVNIDKEKIFIYTLLPNNKDRVKGILDGWILNKTEKELNLSLKRCLKKFPEIKTPKLNIKHMNKRWGSYIKPNTIVLNSTLIYVSKKCIDYVVTHELCHYYHRDHSSAFYSLLGSKIPNWLKIKDMLEQSAYLTESY